MNLFKKPSKIYPRSFNLTVKDDVRLVMDGLILVVTMAYILFLFAEVGAFH